MEQSSAASSHRARGQVRSSNPDHRRWDRPMQDGDEGSITRWIAGVKAGDSAAAQPLWERYSRGWWTGARAAPAAARVSRCRQRRGRRGLERIRQPVARPARGGKVPATRRSRRPLAALGGHHDAEGQRPARRQLRQKRGGGQVQPASDHADPESDDDILARAVGSEPTPEFAVMVAEEYRRLLDRLGDDVLRKLAILRMEGFTTDAIALQLGLRPPHGRAATGADSPHPGGGIDVKHVTSSGRTDMSLERRASEARPARFGIGLVGFRTSKLRGRR